MAVISAALGAVADEAQTACEAVLAQRVAGFDAERAHQAALRAMLTSADPGARWFSEAEAQAWRAQAATNLPKAAEAEVQDWPEGLRYIRVRQISGAARPSLAESLAAAGAAPGLILDLRGAGGTDLAAVVECAGVCVTSGAALFSVIESGGRNSMVMAPTNASALAWPLAVLVDERSTGVAELLAGVLRGRPGVILIGHPTAGGMVRRELLDFGNGRWALAGVVRWVPWGSQHARGGVVAPDVVCEARPTNAIPGTSLGPSPGDKRWSRRTAAEHELIRLVGQDGALQRAVDLLLAARALGSHANQ